MAKAKVAAPVAAKKAPKKESVPAKREERQVAVKSGDVLSMMQADAGKGMEGADRDAFAIPFLRVIQSNSPQIDENDSAHIKGAKSGMLFNTVTNELFDGKDGVIFIPCAFQRRFIQWGPRGSEDGGFKAEWLPEDVQEKRTSGEITESEGHLFLGEPNPKKSDQIVDTRNHFGLIETDDGIAQVLLSLSSTQTKKSKQLMGILSAVRVNGVTPPTWYSKLRLTTAVESNDKGKWYGLKIEAAGFVDDAETYAAGKAFNKIIAEGSGKVDYREAAPERSSAGGVAADDDDEV
jgi:hypothetical protein